MKKYMLLFCLLAVISLSCNLPMLASPTPIPPLANETPAQSPAATSIPQLPVEIAPSLPTQPAGISVNGGNISMVIPDGLASGASSELIARAVGDQVAPWDAAPEHWQIGLENYALQGHFHEPRIYIYPVQDFLTINPELSGNFQNIQAAANGALTAENMPGIPFFNAGQMITTNMQSIAFKNGNGVRLVTQYGQGFGSINNKSLFYHFQGLSSDGKFYIIAILPIIAPILAADEMDNSPVPADGVPFDYNDPNFDVTVYLSTISAKLNALPPEAFTPTLTDLDMLIASIQVNP